MEVSLCFMVYPNIQLRVLRDWVNACSNIVVTSCDNMHLPMSIYPSRNGPRILRVRGYMEMHSMCNLVDVQMMCGIYIY